MIYEYGDEIRLGRVIGEHFEVNVRCGDVHAKELLIKCAAHGKLLAWDSQVSIEDQYFSSDALWVRSNNHRCCAVELA